MTNDVNILSDVDIAEGPLDVPLLRKTLEWATAEWRKQAAGLASEWEQGHFVKKVAGVDCGTACCLAGKIVLDAGYLPVYEMATWADPVFECDVTSWVRDSEGKQWHCEDAAMKLLRMHRQDAERLFSGNNGVHDIWRIAEDITDGEIKASEAFL